MELRPYQTKALDGVRAELRAGRRRVMLCGPTGAGKTNMAGEMIRAAIAKGSRVLFVADRRVLVGQTSRRLQQMEIPHGIIMAGEHNRATAPVHVGSAQTLEHRHWWQNPAAYAHYRPYDLIIVDEAHDRRVATERYLRETGVPAVGLSATPFTRGLGETWDSVVNVRTTNRLIDDGWLVRFKAYVATEIDMTGARVVAGEWSKDEVADRALPLTGDIVSDWIEHTGKHFGGPVRTIVFSSSVAHGDDLREQFAEAGYRFEQITYRDRDPDERDAKIRALATGEVTGLISCEALAKGFDEQAIQCVVMARPYRRAVHSVIQALGRGQRSHPGKDYCLLLDHSGNLLRFAPQIEEYWESGWHSLDDGKRRKVEPRPARESKERKCLGCGFVMPPAAQVCPECGYQMPKRRPTATRPGEMVPYESLRQEVGDIWPHISRLAIDRSPTDHEKALKWALAQYHALTGRWPGLRRNLEPVDVCDHRVADQVKQRFAKWIRQQKRRKKAA